MQNPCKTLGFKKNMVYKIPGGGGGGGKPYPASGVIQVKCEFERSSAIYVMALFDLGFSSLGFRSITFEETHHFHSKFTEGLNSVKYRPCLNLEIIG